MRLQRKPPKCHCPHGCQLAELASKSHAQPIDTTRTTRCCIGPREEFARTAKKRVEGLAKKWVFNLHWVFHQISQAGREISLDFAVLKLLGVHCNLHIERHAIYTFNQKTAQNEVWYTGRLSDLSLYACCMLFAVCCTQLQETGRRTREEGGECGICNVPRHFQVRGAENVLTVPPGFVGRLDFSTD